MSCEQEWPNPCACPCHLTVPFDYGDGVERPNYKMGESVKNVEVKESSKGKYTVTLSRFERDRIAKLLLDEYERVLALPVDESIGFPVGAKVASLVDAREMAEAFGAVIDD